MNFVVISVQILSLFSTGRGLCYLPVEYQGIFSTQSTLSGRKTHKYSQITILPDAIPVWGLCHEINGTTVLLHDDTGGEECFRCFYLSLRSANIIQVYTEGLDKCYTNEMSAKSSCPTEDDINKRIAREIMLYKSRSFTRDGTIDRLLCPFSGQFHFTYNVNDGTENEVECSDPSSSTMSNCPKGSEYQLRFSGCKFQNTVMALQCLGHWEGMDGNKYFALWDNRVMSDQQPQYRCAMYHEEKESGKIFVAFSIDATCTNDLRSPWDGYETMVLSPLKLPSPPAPVHAFSCTFPDWANGDWKDIQIQGRKLWWKDSERDKTYEMLCLSRSPLSGERYALYSRNQCGDEEFTCVWLKRRDENILEFKTASVKHNYFNSTRICADDAFIGEEWRTQGRMTELESVNCPVLGTYTGVIPDAPDFCARLASDCQNPSLMHYTVSYCKNLTQAFERFERRRRKRNIPRRPGGGGGGGGGHTARTPSFVASFPNIRHQSRFGSFPPNRRITTKLGPHLQKRRDSNSWIRNPREERVSGGRSNYDPTYVFPISPSSHRSPTTRYPYDRDRPFYYYIDRYGNAIKEIRSTTVVADREYQCLGQWKEEGIMYTLTYRLNVNTYECFAGVVVNEKEAFIIEAGVNCERGLQPLAKGMKLVREATCSEIDRTNSHPTSSETPPPPRTNPAAAAFPAWWPSTSRKPWLRKSTTTTTTAPSTRWNTSKPSEKSRGTVNCLHWVILSTSWIILTFSIS